MATPISALRMSACYVLRPGRFCMPPCLLSVVGSVQLLCLVSTVRVAPFPRDKAQQMRASGRALGSA